MYFLGFSINNLTLLALTLAIGIVVDDAIIVLENAYRHQEELGEEPEDGRDQRHPRNRLRGDRDHDLAGGGVHAARVPEGQHRAAVQRVRHRGGGLGDHLGLRGADADARCSAPRSSGSRSATASCTSALESGFQRPRPSGYASSLGWALRHRLVAGASRRVGRSRRRPCALQQPQARVRPAGGPRVVHHVRSSRPKARPWRTPTGTSARWRRSSPRPRTSRATSAWSNFGGGVEPRHGLHQAQGLTRRKRTVQQIIGEVQPQFFGIPGVFAFANNPPAFGGFGKPGAVRGAESRLRRAGARPWTRSWPGPGRSRAW